MADAQTQLLPWFEKLKALPLEAHLLCPKLSGADDENYKDLNDPESSITRETKQKRIKDGEARLEITYWNSLVFGFDRRDSGQWVEEFNERLNGCLQECPDCVLNWHMRRKQFLRQFAE
jgi:senataxin